MWSPQIYYSFKRPELAVALNLFDYDDNIEHLTLESQHRASRVALDEELRRGSQISVMGSPLTDRPFSPPRMSTILETRRVTAC